MVKKLKVLDDRIKDLDSSFELPIYARVGVNVYYLKFLNSVACFWQSEYSELILHHQLEKHERISQEY
ncbi:hypothetical protein [Nostoc sp.]|uniref:hypothetical protein n=1 Tax=Nostoc sp. TaxID=1180 RepID=UPI002FFAC75E